MTEKSQMINSAEEIITLNKIYPVETAINSKGAGKNTSVYSVPKKLVNFPVT